MRLIDADALNVSDIFCSYDTVTDLIDVEVWIDKAPTIDAVEVVRCRECRYYRDSLDGYTCENEFWNAEYLVPTEPDDYCAYGERKEVSE